VGVIPANTAGVAQWRNLAASVSHAANAAGGATVPTRIASGLNGLGMIHFVGSSAQKFVTDGPATPVLPKLTIFIVYDNFTPNGSFIGQDVVTSRLLWSDTQFWFDTAGTAITFTGGATMGGSNLFIATIDYTADSYAAYLDGVARGTSTNAGSPGTGNYIFGAGYTALTSDVGEIGIYDRILTADEISTLSASLKLKWGIV
jgi:hypothetical protein